MAKRDEKTIYCIAPTLKGKLSDATNDTFQPGEKFSGKTEECAPLLASGRFTEDESKAKAAVARQKKITQATVK